MPAASKHLRHTGLIALTAPTKLGTGAVLPERIVMLKWGENQTAQGVVKVGMKTRAAAGMWAGIGFGEVAIDFNHNTVPGHPSYRGEPAPIAAMAASHVIEGEGLVFESIAWNEEGRANAQFYPDLSPAVKVDADGEVIFCHSAALARNGAVNDLHLFSAASITAALAAKLKTLTAEPNAKPMLNLDLLKKLLKLPADATEDDLNKALEATEAAPAEDKPATDDMKALSAATLEAIKVIKGDLAGQITTLNARLDGQERAAIVDTATAEGKVVPKEWLPDDKGIGGFSNSQLKTLCATLPITVPLERRTPANVITLNASVATSAEQEVMRTLGISEADWKKHA